MRKSFSKLAFLIYLMAKEKRNLDKMKILVNIIAIISFVAQLLPFAFGALNQKRPRSIMETLYSDFIIFAYICSLITIVIFVIQYNFDIKSLKKKTINYIFLVVLLGGIYIHVSQLLVLDDFILISCILLLFDFYIMRKIWSCLFPK